jgi:hypothetical protein
MNETRKETMGTILLKSGEVIKRTIWTYNGPAFTGDPTAYIIYGEKIVWVKPGESVEWVEA